jgi:hypothetical protein
VARVLLAHCKSPESRAALLTSTVASEHCGASNFQHHCCRRCLLRVCVCVCVWSTALALACGNNRTKMIEFLLREESLPKGPWLTQALNRALPRCSVAILLALLERGARADEPPGQSLGGYYPIHLACQVPPFNMTRTARHDTHRITLTTQNSR